MRTKNILKTCIAALLVFTLCLAVFGCSKKEVIEYPDGQLPNQITNKRYYFQQGYLDNWGVVCINADGYLYDEDTGLLLMLAPMDESGNRVDGVEYCVYHGSSDNINMTSSRADIVGMITDESNSLFFNKKFIYNGERDTYKQSADITLFTAQYSKLQFNCVSYTFTRDGEDWQGMYNIVMNKMEFFVVTIEAKASLWSQYVGNDKSSDYYNTIGDFRKEGWETSQ